MIDLWDATTDKTRVAREAIGHLWLHEVHGAHYDYSGESRYLDGIISAYKAVAKVDGQDLSDDDVSTMLDGYEHVCPGREDGCPYMQDDDDDDDDDEEDEEDE